MKLFIKAIFSFFIIILLSTSLYSDALESMLKQDFTAQQSVLIKFEVNKRLFSFEAGRFKLQKIKKNRDKIRAITKKIIPWGIMEGLEPAEVARIIVYMYHAEEAGASFLDAEDLIPLVAKKDIPLRDFILMVQYNKETKEGDIPEEIRQAFLGLAFSMKWDGMSILAGGRGLLLARASMLDINKVAALLLKKLPAKGAKSSSKRLISIIEDIIGQSIKEGRSQEIVKNLADAHKTAVRQENSPQGLKNIVQKTDRADSLIQKIGAVKIPEKPRENKIVDREQGIIPEIEERPASKGWDTLSRSALMRAIKPWLGTPYKFGCKTGRGGIDCSGFTRVVLTNKKVGVPSDKIGHGTKRQVRAGRAVKKGRLKPGDLVFFSASVKRSKITHVGVATSSTGFSHASSSRGVTHDKITKKWWRQRFVKARRIFANVVD